MNTSQPPDIDALLATLQAEKDKQRKAVKQYLKVLYANVICILLAGILQFVLKSPQWVIFAWFSAFFSFLTLRFIFGDIEKKHKITDALVKAKDVRVIGPLCDARLYADHNRMLLIDEALIYLLPLLKVSDSKLLTAPQWQSIYSRLHGNNAPLVLAILKALEQIGDGGALPYVEKLAEGNGQYLAAKDGRVWNAAKACLPFLRERAAQESVSKTLLRPSAEAASPDTLLRPVTGRTETPPQQLLRANHAEEETA